MGEYQEAARRVPVSGHSEVIVAGAGPAGVAAAVAAARAGASTLLIENQGCLGGIWTAGLLSWVIDQGNKDGLMREITGELQRRDAYAPRAERTDYAYDPEVMKLLLEELCAEAGVRVRLHTRVVAAEVEAGRRLRWLLTESKSGREAWSADTFVDCTGDGDLAAQAGCGFDQGRPGSGQMQPMSLMALVAGIQADDVQPFIGGGGEAAKLALLAEMHRAGVDPSYAKPTLFRIRDTLFALMANHEYGVSGTDTDELTRATLRARREVHALVDALRGLGGCWDGLRIVATGAQIGVREGRRIHGRYTVTEEDLLSGATHADGICPVTFGIDVHATDPAHGKGYGTDNRARTRPYDIPLRALLAKDVDGLLMAGRCISGDFLAHSSYRVTGNAVAMGEAAGRCAALAARTGCLPHEVPFAAVQAR